MAIIRTFYNSTGASRIISQLGGIVVPDGDNYPVADIFTDEDLKRALRTGLRDELSVLFFLRVDATSANDINSAEKADSFCNTVAPYVKDLTGLPHDHGNLSTGGKLDNTGALSDELGVVRIPADTVMGDDENSDHARFGDETWYGGVLRGRRVSDSYPETKWSIDNDAGAADFDSIAGEGANIGFTKSGWPGIANIKDMLDHVADIAEQLGATGRLTPITPAMHAEVGGTSVVIYAGTGQIDYAGGHKHIAWDGTTVDVSSYAGGTWHTYVDENGDVLISSIEPDKMQNIYLGWFGYDGTVVGSHLSSSRVVTSIVGNLFTYLSRLGGFVYEDTGALVVEGGDHQKLAMPQMKVQRGLLQFLLPGRTCSGDKGTKVFVWGEHSDGELHRYRYWENTWGDDGKVPTNCWNDNTQEHNVSLSVDCSFANGSPTVTATGDITSEIGAGGLIWRDADGDDYMMRVQSSSFGGGVTTITLVSNYPGVTGTSAASVCKAFPDLETGKWTKHVVFREICPLGAVHILLGRAQYDDEPTALAGSIPFYDVITEGSIRVGCVVVQQGMTDLMGQIHDLRPMAFPYQTGGGGGGGGGGIAGDHSVLLNLDVPGDHPWATLVNGSRDFTGVQKYATHPAFNADTQLVDKKFVEDSVAAFPSPIEYFWDGARHDAASTTWQELATLTLTPEAAQKYLMDVSLGYTISGASYDVEIMVLSPLLLAIGIDQFATSGDYIYLDAAEGDKTAIFIAGILFSVIGAGNANNNKVYEVMSSTYTGGRTRITCDPITPVGGAEAAGSSAIIEGWPVISLTGNVVISNKWATFTRSRLLDLSAGTYSYKLRFRSSSASGTARVRRILFYARKITSVDL